MNFSNSTVLTTFFEVFTLIASYADIGEDPPDDDEKKLFSMETIFLAILLIIFYYKLFITIGYKVFEWIYSSELPNQFTRSLGFYEDEFPREEFIRFSRRTPRRQ